MRSQNQRRSRSRASSASSARPSRAFFSRSRASPRALTCRFILYTDSFSLRRSRLFSALNSATQQRSSQHARSSPRCRRPHSHEGLRAYLDRCATWRTKESPDSGRCRRGA
eukprot:Amastigsp_a680215_59.p3 type:complete len:111 gc:universal Amastigsp_a680215_59:847-515(-)